MSYSLILGSGSPRRVDLLRQMNVRFEQRVIDIDEVYPNELNGLEIVTFLAKLKGKAHQSSLTKKELVLTADTIVWHNKKALGKPKNKKEAVAMLAALANKTHQVYTAVCLSSHKKQWCIDACTHVSFGTLKKEQINSYIENYKPLDKAGAYGIQEWIGLIGITKIEGSYTNVVGLPTEKTFQLLYPFGLTQ
jgi:septum formation protein